MSSSKYVTFFEVRYVKAGETETVCGELVESKGRFASREAAEAFAADKQIQRYVGPVGARTLGMVPAEVVALQAARAIARKWGMGY
jgi:hypothetical protein